MTKCWALGLISLKHIIITTVKVIIIHVSATCYHTIYTTRNTIGKLPNYRIHSIPLAIFVNNEYISQFIIYDNVRADALIRWL